MQIYYYCIMNKLFVFRPFLLHGGSSFALRFLFSSFNFQLLFFCFILFFSLLFKVSLNIFFSPHLLLLLLIVSLFLGISFSFIWWNGGFYSYLFVSLLLHCWPAIPFLMCSFSVPSTLHWVKANRKKRK